MSDRSQFLQDPLKKILNNIPNMVFVKDAQDLSFILLNKAGEELLGLKEQDILGKKDCDFFPNNQADFFILRDRSVLERGIPEDIPSEPIETASKGRRWLRTKKIPIFDEQGHAIFLLGLSEDITDLKNALDEIERKNVELAHLSLRESVQEEREQYLRTLEKSNRELAEFSQIASHDLKAPLRGFRNYSRFLLEDYQDKIDTPGKDMLHALKNLTERLEVYLDALLNYSRIEKTDFAIRETDIHDLVKDVLKIHALQIQETNTSVTISTKLPTILCDHVRVAEVFKNMIGNALK
jgi:PAS domain S-box-containing protein